MSLSKTVWVCDMPDAIVPTSYPSLTGLLRDTEALAKEIQAMKADGLKVRRFQEELAHRAWQDVGHALTTTDAAIAAKWKMKPQRDWSGKTKRLA